MFRHLFPIFLLFPQISVQTTIKIGLVIDSIEYPQSNNVLSKAIDEVKSNNDAFTIVPESSTVNGCGTGMMQGSGAYQLCDLYSTKNISAVFGPTCYKDMQMSARLTDAWNILQFNFWIDHMSDMMDNTVVQMTTRSAVNVAANIIAAFAKFNWKKIIVYSCPQCYDDPAQGLARTNYIVKCLSDNGITILVQETFLPTDSVEIISTKLNGTRTKGRIFLALAGSTLSNYATFLQATKAIPLPPNEYSIVLTVSQYNVDGLQQPWKSDPNLAQYYKNVIVLYNDCYDSSAAKAFASKMGIGSPSALMLYIQLYESIFFYSDLIEEQRTVTNAKDLLEHVRNRQFTGPFGNYSFNSFNNRITPYRVVQINGNTSLPVEIAKISVQSTSCTGSTNTVCGSLVATLIDNGNGTIAFITDMPDCGFDGQLCSQTTTILVIVGIVIFLTIIIILFVIYRKMKGNEIRDMPWSLPSSSFLFIDVNKELTKDREVAKKENDVNASFQSMQLLQELGPSPPTPPAGTRPVTASKKERSPIVHMPPKTRLATVNNNFALVYTYPFIEKRSNFNKDEIQIFYTMKQAVHDNLNAFLGCSFDSGDFLVAWTMCFKGTVIDVLKAQSEQANVTGEKSLSSNFKGAFVRDLLKGLEFLHASGIQYHGALTPNNCLVDSHWVVKLSGFGMNKIVNRWRHKRTITNIDRSMFIPNSELHYYAPEIRSWWKEVHSSGRNEMGYIPVDMARLADAYSFGMILYEILYHKKYVDIEDDPPEAPLDDDMSVAEMPNYMFSYAAEAKIPHTIDVPETEEIHTDLRRNMMNLWNPDPKKRTQLLLMRRITDSTLKMTGSLVDQMIKNHEQYNNNLENLVQERTAQLEIEQQTADDLLLQLLPKSIASELKMGRKVESKQYKHATILYSDIVGFTALSSESSPMEVVALLSGIFQAFDNIISHHNTYKVETIGDAYMVASGVPELNKNHVKNVASVALMNREFLQGFEIPHRPGQYLHCRWGFNSGPVYTGVVGFNAPRFVIFGSTVNLAAKMESSGVPDKIQMTVKSHQLLTSRFPEFKCSSRGSIKIPGMGTFLTYWLDGVEELLISDRSSYRRVIADQANDTIRAVSRQSIRHRESDTVPLITSQDD